MAHFNISTISSTEKQILEDFYERRKMFDTYISEHKLSSVTCPSCGYPTLGDRGGYDICNVCNWEDDSQDDDRADEIWGGPNGRLSLTESRIYFGRKLDQKVEKGMQVINDPAQIMYVLGVHAQLMEEFLKNNIKGDTDKNDPVWDKYSELRAEVLNKLVETK